MQKTSNGSSPTEDHPEGSGLLLVLGSSSGGVVRHVVQLAAEVAARLPVGSPVRIAGPSDHATLFDSFSYVNIPIGASPHPRDLLNIAKLRRDLRLTAVVHAHGLRAGALTALAARTLGKSRRPRLVITLHNVAVGSRSTRFISRLLERVVARGADVVFGVSSDIVVSAQKLGARVAMRALIPAPNGFASPACSVEQVRAGLGLSASTKIVLTVGRLAPQKGLHTLLAASQLLGLARSLHNSSAKSDFVWLVAGAGPLKAKVAKQIDTEKLPVRLLGARTDVPDLLAVADVVASTAVWEGQPIGIQEALHAGAAIVATDAGGTREVTGESGAVIVPVGAAQLIANEIAVFLDDDDARHEQGRTAQLRARELPGPADMAQQMMRAYGWSQS